jgi:hypothetical protein
VVAGCASASLALGVVVAAAGGSGTVSRQIGSGPGWAWFASQSTGIVSLIDGPTATRVARISDAAAPGDDLEVTSAGADAWVVNRTDGTVRRVDGASLEPQPAMASMAADEGFELVANSDSTWQVVQGRRAVREIDRETGAAIGQLQQVQGSVQTAALAPDGTLWTTDAESDEVASFRHGESRTRHDIDGAEGGHVVVAGETPVVVRNGEPAVALDDDGRAGAETCLTVDDTAETLVAGSDESEPWVLAVDPTAGILTIADLETGECTPVGLGEPSTSPRYGRPVGHLHRVFVADTVAGTAVVIDPSKADPVVARVDLDLPGRPFVLFGVNGFVWFDEPAGDIAGVITDDLRARLVSKTEGDGAPRDPDPTNGPDQKPPDRPEPECRAAPTEALVGQRVLLSVIPNNPDISADSWTWTVSGADLPDGDSGVQIAAVFARAGTFTALATAAAVDGVIPKCQVPVNVLDPQTVTTTTTTPPTTIPQLPATTLPPDTVPPETVTETTSAVTEPPTTVPPPTVPPTTVPPPTVPPTTIPPTTVPPTTAPPTTVPPTTAPVVPVPSFTFSPPSPRVGDVVTFTDTTPGGPFNNTWMFEGANPPTGTGANPTAVWNTTGVFRVTLTADNNGLAASTELPVTVGAVPMLTQVQLQSVLPTGMVDCTSGTVAITFTWSVSATGPLQLMASFPRSDSTTSGPIPVNIPDGPQTVQVQDVWNFTPPGPFTGSEQIVLTAADSTELFRGEMLQANADCTPFLAGYEAVHDHFTLDPFGTVRDTVECPPGKVVVGGGVRSFPTTVSESGPGTVNGGATSLWLATVFNDTSVALQVNIWAMCADPPSGYEVVPLQMDVPGGSFLRDAAACPAGKVVLGGGPTVAGGGNTRVQETAPATTGPNINVWLTSIRNQGATTLTVFINAICADPIPGYEQVRTDIAVGAGLGANGSASCPTGKALLSGGAQVVGAGSADFDIAFREAGPDETSGPSIDRPLKYDVNVLNFSGTDRTMAVKAVCVTG